MRNYNPIKINQLRISIAPGRPPIAPFFWLRSNRGFVLGQMPAPAASDADDGYPPIFTQFPEQSLHLLAGEFSQYILQVRQSRSFRFGFTDVARQQFFQRRSIESLLPCIATPPSQETVKAAGQNEPHTT